MIGLLDYLPNDLLLDFIAENSNLPKTAPREQWFVISRDFCQRGRSDLALDGEAFGEVEAELHGYFLKPVAKQASWCFASWRLTFITFTIVGITHVILADWKGASILSSAGISVIATEGEK